MSSLKLADMNICITLGQRSNALRFLVALDLKKGEVHEGAPSGKADTTLTVADDDFVDIALNKLNPQTAFMKGKLKIQGNIMMAQKLGPLLKTEAKL